MYTTTCLRVIHLLTWGKRFQKKNIFRVFPDVTIRESYVFHSSLSISNNKICVKNENEKKQVNAMILKGDRWLCSSVNEDSGEKTSRWMLGRALLWTVLVPVLMQDSCSWCRDGEISELTAADEWPRDVPNSEVLGGVPADNTRGAHLLLHTRVFLHLYSAHPSTMRWSPDTIATRIDFIALTRFSCLTSEEIKG